MRGKFVGEITWSLTKWKWFTGQAKPREGPSNSTHELAYVSSKPTNELALLSSNPTHELAPRLLPHKGCLQVNFSDRNPMIINAS